MDPFVAALDAYRDRFGSDAMPDLFGLHPENFDAAAAALRDAVARGRPLTPAEVRAVTAGTHPAPTKGRDLFR